MEKITSNTNVKVIFLICSFDLELTGRSYPPSEIGKTTKTIERGKKLCYHHHIDDPTKVVELDPLPNNSTQGDRDLNLQTDLDWAFFCRFSAKYFSRCLNTTKVTFRTSCLTRGQK